MLLFVSAHGAHNIEAQDGVLVENAGAWLAACQSLALSVLRSAPSLPAHHCLS